MPKPRKELDLMIFVGETDSEHATPKLQTLVNPKQKNQNQKKGTAPRK